MIKRNSIDILLEKEKILYKLARLMRNTDCIHPTTKGRMEGDLLSQLRILDNQKYDKLILGKESNGSIINNMIDKIQDALENTESME